MNEHHLEACISKGANSAGGSKTGPARAAQVCSVGSPPREARPASVPSPQPAVLHGQPSPLSLPFFSEAACTPPRGAGSCFRAATPFLFKQQQPHAVGHEERWLYHRWLCHLAEAGCFHACAALRPEQKNQSHVAPAVRVFPSSTAHPRAKTQLAEMATAEQLDAMSPVDRSQLVRCMQAPLPASAAASLHCSTQLASSQRAPLKRAPRSVLHSACDATISPTILTHK